MRTLIGEILGNRYEIVSEIGSGGMAIVYQAKDRLLGRTVAVKVLRSQYAADADFRDRFQREAQSAASLSHPNVVQIFDVGSDDSVHYIVMEYVQGRNLKEILRESGRLPIPTAVHIAQQICRALAAAHRNNVIHRDVKPHNILVTDENHIKVTDFGIARAASAVSVTQTGTLLGTVHYVSPEQARGRTVTAASDVYSLGVLCYEMLTGRVPFEGESALTVAMKHLEEEPSPLRRWVPDIPLGLEAVVLRALRKEPRQRYRDGGAMLADLRPFSQGEPEQLPLTAAAPEKAVRSAWWSRWKRGTKQEAAVAQEATIVRRPGDEAKKSRRRREPRRSRQADLEATRVVRPNDREGTALATQESEQGIRRRNVWLAIFFFICFSAGVLYVTVQSEGFQNFMASIMAVIRPPEVEVPEIVGRSIDEARELLAAQGLHLRVNREVNSERPVNTVVRQQPEANRIVRQGRTIEVDVSIGVEMVAVPDLFGQSERSARIELARYALELGSVETGYQADVPSNIVIGQTPAPHERVQVGSRVDIVLSTGAPPLPLVTVPDFTGRHIDEVLAEVEAMGLVIGSTFPEDDPRVAPGEVIAQDLPAGDEVEVGRKINFAYRAMTPSNEPDPEPPSTPVEPHTPSSDRVDALITITVPPGPTQRVQIVVIDNLSVRTVYDATHSGGARLRELIVGHGSEAVYQVWIGGTLVAEGPIRNAQ